MLEWTDYIENAERNTRLEVSERWTVNGVNVLIAWQTVAWAGYGDGWASFIIFFGVWFGLTFVLADIASREVSKSWSSEAYMRKIEAPRRGGRTNPSAPRCSTRLVY